MKYIYIFSTYWSAFTPLRVLWCRIFFSLTPYSLETPYASQMNGEDVSTQPHPPSVEVFNRAAEVILILFSGGEVGEAALRGRTTPLINHLHCHHCGRLFQIFRQKIFQQDQVHAFRRQKIQGLISTTKTKLKLSPYIYMNFINHRSKPVFRHHKKISPSRFIKKRRTRIKKQLFQNLCDLIKRTCSSTSHEQNEADRLKDRVSANFPKPYPQSPTVSTSSPESPKSSIHN